MNKIIPFGNNILVKPFEQNTILKSTEGSLCQYGKVLAVGKDVIEIKEGDIIGYTVFGVNSLEIENEKHYLIPETSEFVLATITV